MGWPEMAVEDAGHGRKAAAGLSAMVMTGWGPGVVASALGPGGTVALVPGPPTTPHVRAAIDAVAGR